MATKTKNTNEEVGIIGQMYEDRKTGRVGVLEERNPKFKSLMFRDTEGATFNIVYSTFRSNWRKYQGDKVIKTSTQVEEEKVEAKKELDDAKLEMSKSTETTIKFSKDERVRAVNALRVVLNDAIKNAKYPLEIVPLAKGGTVVKLKGKRRTMFEVWLPLRYPDIYSFRLREDLDKFVNLDEKREYIEKDINCIRYRPKRERFNDVLSVMLIAIEKFVDETDFLVKGKTEENDKTEEEEKN